MTDEVLIGELAQAQLLVRALIEDLDDATYRTQYHVDLSPIGWHLGHCVYFECLWLHEKIRGDASVTAPIADLYTPPKVPKEQRGGLLPLREALLEWAHALQSHNLDYLRNLQPEWRQHDLFSDDYVVHFILQHYSQHYETMIMVLTQKALREHRAEVSAQPTLQAAALSDERIDIPAGHYRVGGEPPQAYDNELPPQHAELGPFSISRNPVSNAEYLAFMEDGGYQREELWKVDAWKWRQRNNIEHPDHWRRDPESNWYSVGIRGAYELTGEAPVSGISHYEARAFARWAKTRLPHEYQWEAACRSGVLEQTGRVWEWCENVFHPYAGFEPLPYPEYSASWFDDKHYVLRGGSLHTRPSIKRPSFRNFYEADKRHIFSGLRLAF
ncbi:MAG: SUMF1/EgtB/PvdO family nonheme iron enzyme [Thiogranum sp.]|nr:SUMF1/EgtB/PvdO family nonheme iron enzyme [Thiogranum sp.]